MSLTSHDEEIGHVGQVCYEDPHEILVMMSRGCCAENGPVEFKLNSKNVREETYGNYRISEPNDNIATNDNITS